MNQETTSKQPENLDDAYKRAEQEQQEAAEREEAARKTALNNEMMNLESQMSDILGELDNTIKDAKPTDRIRALGTKLRYLEIRRHHQAQLAVANNTRQQILGTLETAQEAFDVWLRQQKEIHHAPGHMVTRLRAMGLHIEASGPEDDPNYQRIAKTIEAISVDMGKLKAEIVHREMTEQEQHAAHERKMREERNTSKV